MYDVLEEYKAYCEFDGIKIVFKNDGRYYVTLIPYKVTLGEFVEVFHDQSKNIVMLIGYTHNIISLRETENLVTVM